MDAKDPEIADRLGQIFFPFAVERTADLVKRKGRFVHYTSAENAINIFNSKQVWLRSARSMNDFMEVEHGFQYLLDFFQKDENKFRKEFYNIANGFCEGAAEEAIKPFDQWLPTVRFNTYLACFSEHDDDEDAFGRLSMWRTYGRSSVGVAIVLNSAPFMLKSETLNIFASPVSYLSREKFHEGLLSIMKRMNAESEFLKSVPRQVIINSIFAMLLLGSTCSKHPGFREEREWRVIAVPKIFPSPVLSNSIEMIAGIPQLVFKVPLKDIPDQGLVGVEIPAFVDRVIIGPSNYPLPIFDAFVATLEATGMQDAASKVIVSNIPLRT
jgi:hypothetical protein